MLGEALLGSCDAGGAEAEAELRRALEFGHAQPAVIPLLAAALVGQQQPTKVLERYSALALADPLGDAMLKTPIGVGKYCGWSGHGRAGGRRRAASRARIFARANAEGALAGPQR